MRKIWREGHRRSSRISALNANNKIKDNKAQVSRFNPARFTTNHVKKCRRFTSDVGPSKAKKKRKLSSVVQQDPRSSDEDNDSVGSLGSLPKEKDKPLGVKDNQKNQDQVANPGKAPVVQCASWMPEKRILELILDVLQRKDTHEIFAEPVDQEEVEDYYNIIEEPMDFGTMRAKLHEGMYKSLEQFEHDVFLIFRNAMYFNSRGTLYYGQAHAIDELAKKVFHSLKTDPENFEFEYSGARRRTNRRLKSEAKNSTQRSSSKFNTKSRSKNGTLNASRVSMLSSTMQLLPGCSTSGTQLDLIDDEVPFGGGSGAFEGDRRSTYSSFLSADENSIVSSVCGNSEVLMHINQQDFCYRESLMLFAKDLGPIAQMVAKRKLNEAANYASSASSWSNAPNCQPCASSTLGQLKSTAMDMNSQNLINGYRPAIHERQKSYCGDKIGIFGSSSEVVSHGFDNSSFGFVGQEPRSIDNKEAGGVSESNIFQQNQNSITRVGLPSSTRSGVTLNLMNDHTLLSPGSAAKDFQQNASRHRQSNNYNGFSPSLWNQDTAINGNKLNPEIIGAMNNLASPFVRSYDQAVMPQGATHEPGGSTRVDQALNSGHLSGPSAQFTFGLPFLKAKLDTMNSFGQQSTGGEGPFLDKMSKTYSDNHPHYAFDTQLTNLALQL